MTGQPGSPGEAIAVIGLGLMGSRMAGRLLRAGHVLHGFDPDRDALREFEAAGGLGSASAAEAVSGCWAVLLSLPDSDISRRVCLDPDGISDDPPGQLLVYDTTTGRPDDAVSIATALADAGVEYSDTTVSGNGQTAEQGQLVVMLGGTDRAYSAGRPIFEAIGRSHHHVGPVGAGSRMKLIVNHVLGIHRLALAEALVVAELAGIDLSTTLAVLKDGLAYSKAMDSWGQRMIDGDHEPPFSRMRQSMKDSDLIVQHGASLGAELDLAAAVNSALHEAVEAGLGDLDNSGVVEVVRRRSRLLPPS